MQLPTLFDRLDNEALFFTHSWGIFLSAIVKHIVWIAAAMILVVSSRNTIVKKLAYGEAEL